MPHDHDNNAEGIADGLLSALSDRFGNAVAHGLLANMSVNDTNLIDYRPLDLDHLGSNQESSYPLDPLAIIFIIAGILVGGSVIIALISSYFCHHSSNEEQSEDNLV